jgi:hypothetical protein
MSVELRTTEAERLVLANLGWAAHDKYDARAALPGLLADIATLTAALKQRDMADVPMGPTPYTADELANEVIQTARSFNFGSSQRHDAVKAILLSDRSPMRLTKALTELKQAQQRIGELEKVARMAMQPERDAYDQYHDWHSKLRAAARATLSPAATEAQELAQQLENINDPKCDCAKCRAAAATEAQTKSICGNCGEHDGRHRDDCYLYPTLPKWLCSTCDKPSYCIAGQECQGSDHETGVMCSPKWPWKETSI